MMVTLGAPLFLLLLIPLAALIVIAGRQLGGAGRSVALALRCASLALLIVALAQPTWAAGRAAPVLFVVDRSASITPAMRADEEAWLRSALDAIPPAAGRGVVTFAGGALLQVAGDGRQATGDSKRLSPVDRRLSEGQTD